MSRASSWKKLQDIARRQWGRLTGANLDWTAVKASREQVVEWLAREHKRDPIHK
ncbi:MAG TPA: hypothetical protein VN675_12560 [Burkholderiales bacterium]|nr:hypothetical protein [Burkholderiales bacterium]